MNRSLVVGLIAITLLPLWLVCKERQPDAPRAATVTLGQLEIDAASEFARLAINCIQNEFPNKTGHVLSSSADACYPQALHPAFYGCFDWHSAVHGHWLLVRLLKRFPALPEAKEIRQLLEQNLTQENIAAEVRYFSQPLNRSFERTYGWAWLLKLAEELHDWPDTDAMRWCANLQPLADLLVQRYQDFLPRQTYPIRTGVHPNTAFGLAFAIDYGQAVGDNNFVSLITERSRSYFFADRDYPVDWEPGGEDFFSPALMEADLMRRVLSAQEFSEWFEAFLPALFTDEPLGWLEPAHVSDRSDPKIVHLDGLNLSRAWCLSGIAKKLPAHHPIKGKLLAAAARHAQATLPYISSGQYEGEHWLASFAVYLFREVSLNYPGEVSRYHGFRRYDFLHKGRAAIIVAPDSAADGLPWIWRARFFEHEPQTDLALLHKGFHLVYIDVVDLFGAPQAVAIWNDFYEFLTGRFHFCRKPVLEGLSRGGLIIYNWAIQNPDKVACLYGDAPVCDLKSWPGPERTEMMEAYNFRNQEEFFAYPGNPVDNLAPLAEADVPILHVVGEADQVVPVAENTDVVEERYRKLGGRMHVIRKPGVGHHPHSLTDPTPIVDFVLQQVDCP